ncbi:MAG TPA: AAA family ATPase [Candidatus Scalindua sp.]|nr:AAA family ATPase [Candidatus Scalindua sp.]
MEIIPATRKGITPLIALYSESGCGKTFSSLLMARGMAGPEGKIVMIETEGGRGELYADIPEIGGYDVLKLEDPFSPQKYIKALSMIQEAGACVGILDSGSHEWEGIGGILDMATENEARSGKPGLHNWKKPKFEHAKFIQALTKIKIPLIVCLRAKFKTRQIKVKGKTQIVKDDHTSPIQAEDFIFEATCHGEITPDHKLRLTKWSHPKLKECFPNNAPITIETGQKIAAWCASPGTVPAESERVKVDFETIRTGVAKVTKSEGIFKIYGSGNVMYTTDRESFAKIAKKANEAGCEIEIMVESGKLEIENIEMIEP